MGTFGNTVIPAVLVKDWSEFWQRWNQNTAWDLEYYDGSGWVSVKSDLQVQKTFPQEWLCKLTLKFTASQAADYRLTFAINKAVKDYVHKEAEHCYSITVDDETLLFDWNDVLAIPGIVISHGVKDGFFWWRLRRDNVPLGAQVTIDPTFGYETIGGSSLLISDVGVENITGSVFTITENGVGESITVALKRNAAGSDKVKCAIYKHSDLSFVGVTEERTLSLTTSLVWYTFNFVVSKPNFTQNVEYILVVWADYTNSYMSIAVAASAADLTHQQNIVYNGFPNPYDPIHCPSAVICSIYCTYIPPSPGTSGAFVSYTPRYRTRRELEEEAERLERLQREMIQEEEDEKLLVEVRRAMAKYRKEVK